MIVVTVPRIVMSLADMPQVEGFFRLWELCLQFQEASFFRDGKIANAAHLLSCDT